MSIIELVHRSDRVRARLPWLIVVVVGAASSLALWCTPFSAAPLSTSDPDNDGGKSDTSGKSDANDGADVEAGPPPCPNGALDFAGGYVEVPTNPSLDPSRDVTVEAWIKPLTQIASSEVHIVSHHDHNNSDGYVLMLFNGLVLRIYTGTGGQMAEIRGPAFSLGVWHHVAGVLDVTAKVLRLFVDGMRVKETATNVVRPDPYNGPLRIGRAAYTDGFEYGGIIDEVRVSSAVRYAAAFKPSYPLPDDDPNTIGTWHFTEGSGGIAKEARGRLQDGVLLREPTTVPKPTWIMPECPTGAR